MKKNEERKNEQEQKKKKGRRQRKGERGKKKDKRIKNKQQGNDSAVPGAEKFARASRFFNFKY